MSVVVFTGIRSFFWGLPENGVMIFYILPQIAQIFTDYFHYSRCSEANNQIYAISQIFVAYFVARFHRFSYDISIISLSVAD